LSEKLGAEDDERQNAFRCACEFNTHPYLKTSVKMRFVAPASSIHTPIPIRRQATAITLLRPLVISSGLSRRRLPLGADDQNLAADNAAEFDQNKSETWVAYTKEKRLWAVGGGGFQDLSFWDVE
jgi:hypothetical protein